MPHGELQSHADTQRGSAFIMAIVLLFLLTVTGIALLFLGDSDTKMNLANVRDKRTFYLAEAGLEHAREQLRLNNIGSADTGKFTDEITTAAGANGIVEFDPASVIAVYDANGNCDEIQGIRRRCAVEGTSRASAADGMAHS
jgi:Tfp pilus assembly protein PilX